MKIKAYAYEAALHCIECTLKRHRETPFATLTGWYGKWDENGLPCESTDSEGNPVTPVFSLDELDGQCCDDCFQDWSL